MADSRFKLLAGIGGGGIVSSVWIITAEIVEVEHRPKWSQALSVTWSCSAIAGPLLGGVFSGKFYFYTRLNISMTWVPRQKWLRSSELEMGM